jgi:S1/P1 nuclease
MKQLRYVLSVFVLGCSSAALGWNDFGHMTVAEAAYQRLTPQAKRRVAELLRVNPSYSAWVQGVPSSNAEEVAFVKAATWPDEIKESKDYRDDADNSPEAARNIGYADDLRHRYWHYIDLPFSPDGTAIVPPAEPNVQTQIAAFRKALHSEARFELKSYDLVWLLHLVGDVHQPLHAISRFTKDLLRGDQGGHLVVLCVSKCDEDLHNFWDNSSGEDKALVFVRWAAAALPRADPELVAIKDEAVWVRESFELAKSSVYVPPVGVGRGPFRVDPTYGSIAKRIAAQRIALGGARLARLLNDALDGR